MSTQVMCQNRATAKPVVAGVFNIVVGGISLLVSAFIRSLPSTMTILIMP